MSKRVRTNVCFILIQSLEYSSYFAWKSIEKNKTIFCTTEAESLFLINFYPLRSLKFRNILDYMKSIFLSLSSLQHFITGFFCPLVSHLMQFSQLFYRHHFILLELSWIRDVLPLKDLPSAIQSTFVPLLTYFPPFTTVFIP